MKHASYLIVLLAAISVLLAGCVDSIPDPNDQAPIDPVDGVCGSLAGEVVTEQTFQSASGTQLCSDSTAIEKGLSGSTYSWTCPGLRGGEEVVCQASLATPEEPPEDMNESDLPQPGESVPQDSFRGWYYNNSDFTDLYDTRIDQVIAFDWEGAPIDGMGADTFSVEWQGRFTFREGYYDFFVEADDGVRIYVDDLLVFNEWREQDESFTQRVHFNETRVYTLRVLQYDNEYSAKAALEWEYVGLSQNECQSNSDCSNGEVCETACESNAGCSSDEVCESGLCVGAPVSDGSCVDNTDCSNGEVCEPSSNTDSGVCVEQVANTETDADGYDGELLAWAPYETPGQVETIANYEPLDDQTFTGAIRVRVPDGAGLDSVTFYLNDDAMNTDTSAPFDMGSGTNNKLTLAKDELTIDARLLFEDSSERNLTATFTVVEAAPPPPQPPSSTEFITRFEPTEGSGSAYRIGAEIAFEIVLEENARVTLESTAPDGSTSELASNIAVRADSVSVLDGRAQGVVYLVTPPQGEYTVTASATTSDGRTDTAETTFVASRTVSESYENAMINVKMRPGTCYQYYDLVEGPYQVPTNGDRVRVDFAELDHRASKNAACLFWPATKQIEGTYVMWLDGSGTLQTEYEKRYDSMYIAGDGDNSYLGDVYPPLPPPPPIPTDDPVDDTAADDPYAGREGTYREVTINVELGVDSSRYGDLWFREEGYRVYQDGTRETIDLSDRNLKLPITLSGSSEYPVEGTITYYWDEDRDEEFRIWFTGNVDIKDDRSHIGDPIVAPPPPPPPPPPP